MKKLLTLMLSLLAATAGAQEIRNPKLSPLDLEAALTLAREVGGQSASLVYATRLDPIQKTSFDCLLVVYAKASDSRRDFFAFIYQESTGRKLILAADTTGRAIPAGDRFLRVGLRHQPQSPPILRLMSAFSTPQQGELQRNLDFQLTDSAFTLVSQSSIPVPK